MQGNKSDLQNQEQCSSTATEASVAENAEAKDVSRRGFVKKAAIGAVALAGTSELARQVVSSVPRQSPQDFYDRDMQAAQRALSEMEGGVMSEEQKQDMIQTMLDNYQNPA